MCYYIIDDDLQHVPVVVLVIGCQLRSALHSRWLAWSGAPSHNYKSCSLEVESIPVRVASWRYVRSYPFSRKILNRIMLYVVLHAYFILFIDPLGSSSDSVASGQLFGGLELEVVSIW